MNKQRGFGVVAVLYIVAALVALGIGYGVVSKYNSAIEGRKTAEAALATCKTNYESLLGKVNTQNLAIRDLAAERDKAQEIAKAALATADKLAAARAPERRRLAELEKAAKGTGPCPAGVAISEFRKGLKP